VQTIITCDSCRSRLGVPDTLAGKRVKCPKCGIALSVPKTKTDTAITSATPSRSRLVKPAPASEPKSVSARKVPAEPPAEAEPAPDKPRPKKKKKKRRPSGQKLSLVPAWVWWLGSVAVFFGVAILLIVLAALSGAKASAVVYGVVLLIMLPVSTVILIASMILSSHLAGGIEFGEVHVVIPKALALLLVVNLVGLLPMGGYLALPFWLFGLMYLFSLDLWEARFLITINWGLNLVVRLFFVTAIVSAMQHGKHDLGGDRPRPVLNRQQSADLKAIEALGGDWDVDEDNPTRPVVHISLADTQAKDADLERLKAFPQLQSLDLSGTRVTDAGVATLKGLSSLKSLILTGTAVTNASVNDLKQALPELQVIR
jgi:hypothetical protein